MNFKAILAACAILTLADAAFCADGRFALVEKGEAKVCVVRSSGVEMNFCFASASFFPQPHRIAVNSIKTA